MRLRGPLYAKAVLVYSYCVAYKEANNTHIQTKYRIIYTKGLGHKYLQRQLAGSHVRESKVFKKKWCNILIDFISRFHCR